VERRPWHSIRDDEEISSPKPPIPPGERARSIRTTLRSQSAQSLTPNGNHGFRPRRNSSPAHSSLCAYTGHRGYLLRRGISTEERQGLVLTGRGVPIHSRMTGDHAAARNSAGWLKIESRTSPSERAARISGGSTSMRWIWSTRASSEPLKPQHPAKADHGRWVRWCLFLACVIWASPELPASSADG